MGDKRKAKEAAANLENATAAGVKTLVSDVLDVWASLKAIPSVDVLQSLGAVLGAVEEGLPLATAVEVIRETVKQGGAPGGRYDHVLRYARAVHRNGPAGIGGGQAITGEQYGEVIALGTRFLDFLEKQSAEAKALGEQWDRDHPAQPKAGE